MWISSTWVELPKPNTKVSDKFFSKEHSCPAPCVIVVKVGIRLQSVTFLRDKIRVTALPAIKRRYEIPRHLGRYLEWNTRCPVAIAVGTP